MSNETSAQAPVVQEDPEESSENIPPGVINTPLGDTSKKHLTPSASKDLRNTTLFSCDAGALDPRECRMEAESLFEVSSLLDDTWGDSMLTLRNDSALPDSITSMCRTSAFRSSLTPQFKIFNLAKIHSTPSAVKESINRMKSLLDAGGSDVFWLDSETTGGVSILENTIDDSIVMEDSALPGNPARQPASVIPDISSSSKMCTLSSNSDIGNSSKVTELQCEQMKTSASPESDQQDSHSSFSTNVTKPVSSKFESPNVTFTTDQPSRNDLPTTLNTTKSIQNQTLHLSPAVENSSEPISEKTSSFASETQLVMDLTYSGGQKSSRNPVLGETFSMESNTDECTPTKENVDITSSQPNPVDQSPSKTCNITHSFKDAANLQDMDQSPSKTCNLTHSFKDAAHLQNVDQSPSKTCNITHSFKDAANLQDMDHSPSKTCNLTHSFKDAAHLQNVDQSPSKTCNITHSFKDAEHLQNVDQSPSKTCNITHSFKEGADLLQNNENANANKDHTANNISKTPQDASEAKTVLSETFDDGRRTFNLEGTLDLKEWPLVTSTPMTSDKMFNLNEKGEKKQNQRDDDKPAAAASSSDIPPNLVCVPNNFLKQPVSKILFLAPRATSQLLKNKLTSAIAGPPSGLPMTRLRTQAESSKSAPKIPPMTSKPSNTYNLRATASALKPPNPAMQRMQASAATGISKATAGLRPPSKRSYAATSSSVDKPDGSTVPNPATKTSLLRMQPLARGDTCASKRMKMDAEPSTAVVPTKSIKRQTVGQRKAQTQRNVLAAAAEPMTSSDTGSKPRTLKQPLNVHKNVLPKAPGHGCANCVSLLEENKRLREELLKYKKKEEADN